MVEGRTLWELVEHRAQATPEAIAAVDEHGRQLTFAEYRDQAETAAAGIHGLGIGAGDVVSWQLPTWLESLVLVAALSRLGAIQNPILPIYRRREVGFITAQAGSRLLIVPPRWRDFDFAAMAHDIAAEQDGLDVLVADRAAAAGRPGSGCRRPRTHRTTPPISRSAGTTTRRGRRPTRRGRSTPT